MRRHIYRDWSEDFHQENGNYTSLCALCGESFTGNKHRYVCKRCFTVKRRKKRPNPHHFIWGIIGFLYVIALGALSCYTS